MNWQDKPAEEKNIIHDECKLVLLYFYAWIGEKWEIFCFTSILWNWKTNQMCSESSPGGSPGEKKASK